METRIENSRITLSREEITRVVQFVEDTSHITAELDKSAPIVGVFEKKSIII